VTGATLHLGGPVRHAQPGSWRRWCACGVPLAGATRELMGLWGRSWSVVCHQPCGCVWEGPGAGDDPAPVLTRWVRARWPWRRWRDAPHPARRFLAGYERSRDRRRSAAEPPLLAVTADGRLLRSLDGGPWEDIGSVLVVDVRLDHRHDEEVRTLAYQPPDPEAPARSVTFTSPTRSWPTVGGAVLAGQTVTFETQVTWGPDDPGPMRVVGTEELPGPWLSPDLWDQARQEPGGDYDHEETRRRLAAVDKTLDEAAVWEARWEQQAHRYIPPGEDEPEP
jgi:hypothetical protein